MPLSISCDICSMKVLKCVHLANECLLSDIENDDCSDFTPNNLQINEIIDHLNANGNSFHRRRIYQL